METKSWVRIGICIFVIVAVMIAGIDGYNKGYKKGTESKQCWWVLRTNSDSVHPDMSIDEITIKDPEIRNDYYEDVLKEGNIFDIRTICIIK